MFYMLMSAIVEKCAGRRPLVMTWAKVGVALLIGVGLGYAPTLGLGQGKAELLGVMPYLPPQAQAHLGGNKVASVRVVKLMDPATKKYGVDTYARDGSKTHMSEGAEGDPYPKADFDVSTSGDNVSVTIQIPKDYLLQFDQPGDPVEVISAGVVVKAGKSTCIWDCYWSNGRKICECVEI